MDYKNRLKKLQAELLKLRCDILIIEDVTNIYYMTGLELSTGKLLVDPDKAYLFVDARYYENCQKHSPFPVVLLENNALQKWFSQRKSLATVGFDSTTTPYNQYLEWKRQLQAVKKQLGATKALKFVALKSPLRPLRLIKDAEEIELLKKAGVLGSEGFDFLTNCLSAGVAENELALQLELFWKQKGAKGLAFDPIIAFGANSSMPHYRPGGARLKKGDSILIDIGVNVKHYHSDMTRVLFYNKPTREMEAIYLVVREAQKAALKLCRPGTAIKELDIAARSYIEEKGFGKQFTHNLGHGVGLEIHEAPTISQKGPDKSLKLQEGMVITIEPGIYLPDIGGVRLEDTVVITAGGYENLTNRPL